MGDASHSGMSGPRPADVLTDAQLACVRLVHIGPSKVIAQRLGCSHHTVDDHLRQAMRRLGVQTRHEAAAIVAEWDRAYPQMLMPQPETLADQADAAILAMSAVKAATPVSSGNVVREERAAYGTPDLSSIGWRRLTQYWFGSLFDDLTGTNRLRGAATMALIFAFIVLVLVGLGNAVQASIHPYAIH